LILLLFDTMSTHANNPDVIPEIATKIKALAATKQVYLKFIVQLFPLLKKPLLCEYANELVILLQNLINIHQNKILFELEDALSSVLVTYIYDIADLIGGRLDLEKYEPRHQNLLIINKQTDYHMKHNNSQGLAEFKINLFLI
jgi:hypothetical protein